MLDESASIPVAEIHAFFNKFIGAEPHFLPFTKKGVSVVVEPKRAEGQRCIIIHWHSAAPNAQKILILLKECVSLTEYRDTVKVPEWGTVLKKQRRVAKQNNAPGWSREPPWVPQ